MFWFGVYLEDVIGVVEEVGKDILVGEVGFVFVGEVWDEDSGGFFWVVFLVLEYFVEVVEFIGVVEEEVVGVEGVGVNEEGFFWGW